VPPLKRGDSPRLVLVILKPSSKFPEYILSKGKVGTIRGIYYRLMIKRNWERVRLVLTLTQRMLQQNVDMGFRCQLWSIAPLNWRVIVLISS